VTSASVISHSLDSRRCPGATARAKHQTPPCLARKPMPDPLSWPLPAGPQSSRTKIEWHHLLSWRGLISAQVRKSRGTIVTQLESRFCAMINPKTLVCGWRFAPWAQINCGNLIITKEEKGALDDWYIRNASLWLDARIAPLYARCLVERRAKIRAGRARSLCSAPRHQPSQEPAQSDGSAPRAGGNHSDCLLRPTQRANLDPCRIVSAIADPLRHSWPPAD
jgi:hypothetical protein